MPRRSPHEPPTVLTSHHPRRCRRRRPLRPWRVLRPRRREAQARRADRHRLVRQVRSVPADPGGAGRSRLALRCGSRRCSPTPPTWSRTRQASKKKPRTYGDYREMLKEKDLDIVLIGTPDHWHALPMIAAVEAGADVYCQKPISVDIAEGQAMLAAARKHNRVVQIGTQRRSTPHLIEASDQIIKEGKLGKIGAGRDLLLLPHARDGQPAGHRAAGEPRLRDVDRPRADAAVQQARPPAQLAGVHGIRQRHRRRHVRPHARHDPLDAGPRLAQDASPPPAASSSTRHSKANISDTQTATFDFGDLR